MRRNLASPLQYLQKYMMSTEICRLSTSEPHARICHSPDFFALLSILENLSYTDLHSHQYSVVGFHTHRSRFSCVVAAVHNQ